MLYVIANNGISPRVVNPFDPADVTAMAATTSITVTLFGAGKSDALRRVVSRITHYGYVFGYSITVGEITSKRQFRVTIDGLLPGTAHLWAVIIGRIVGRQIIKNKPLKTYSARSEIRKQLVKQWCPSVCDGGSDLRDATNEVLDANDDFQEYISPVFTIYGLYQHGSIEIPATV